MYTLYTTPAIRTILTHQQMLTSNITKIDSEYLYDMQYDHYGRRLATSGSDHRIRIYTKHVDATFQEEATLEGHKGSVWGLSWVSEIVVSGYT